MRLILYVIQAINTHPDVNINSLTCYFDAKFVNVFISGQFLARQKEMYGTHTSVNQKKYTESVSKNTDIFGLRLKQIYC